MTYVQHVIFAEVVVREINGRRVSRGEIGEDSPSAYQMVVGKVGNSVVKPNGCKIDEVSEVVVEGEWEGGDCGGLG